MPKVDRPLAYYPRITRGVEYQLNPPSKTLRDRRWKTVSVIFESSKDRLITRAEFKKEGKEKVKREKTSSGYDFPPSTGRRENFNEARREDEERKESKPRDDPSGLTNRVCRAHS